MVEHFINFVLHHNEMIIQWLIAIVVGLALMIMGLSLFRRSDQADGQERRAQDVVTNGPTVSAILKESHRENHKEPQGQAPQVGVGGGTGVASSSHVTTAPGAQDNTLTEQLTQLQKDLATKTQEVESLKSQLSAVSPQTEASSDHSKKVKELETKLAEYEILEDDIANLTLFKEENVKLKAELAQLRGPEGSSANSELSSPLSSEPSSQVKAQTAEVKEGDDLLTEFAASLAEAHPETASEQTTSEQLESPQLEADKVDTDKLDTDKMLSEVKDLEQLPSVESSSLEEPSDMEKMSAEASQLLGNS